MNLSHWIITGRNVASLEDSITELEHEREVTQVAPDIIIQRGKDTKITVFLEINDDSSQYIPFHSL